MLRRSVLTEASFALSLVAANLGIAIAAKMPMITTTMRSSIRVKPFRFLGQHGAILREVWRVTARSAVWAS